MAHFVTQDFTNDDYFSMTIATGASDGVRADSAAKESAGAAATLGSQAAAAANEVIVPDAISANNEGNLEVSPSYVGRMIAIRPWEMKLAAVPVVVAGGSTYSVSDTIDLNGVAGVTGTAVVTVSEVLAGAVVAVTITEADGVQIRRGAMTSAPSPADNPVGQAATSGSGTGATFDCIWEPHFELRFITGDATNTLTVHEDWIVPPVSGDNWAVAYTLDDYATLTGVTLRAQSGVFECTRRLKVGPSTDTARHGWLAFNNGKQVELDNVDTDTFEMANGGIWTVGYTQGGVSVNGGYISGSGTTGAAIALNTNNGAIFFLHDLQIRSPREDISWATTLAEGDITEAERLFRKQVGAVVRGTKMLDVKGLVEASNHRWRDLTVQATTTATDAFDVRVHLDGAGGDEGQSCADINRATLIRLGNSNGFTSVRTTFTAEVVFDFLRNIRFLEARDFCQVEENETWRFVNPAWSPVLTDQNDFDFNSATGSSIEELMSLIVRPIEADGTPISGVQGYVFEGDLNDNLPAENTNQSVSVAYDPVADSRFEDEIEAGDVAYFCDVLSRVYFALTTTSSVKSITGGTFAWRGYLYDSLPVTVPLTIDLDGGVDTQSVFLADPAITEPVAATALTNPTTNPTVVKHSSGETDPLPMKALNYDAGVATAPTIGETLTQGSATGDVVDFEGSGASGTVLLENWNGVEFTNDQNITGATFDATTDLTGGTGFYEEYTWEVNAQDEAMTIVYDYLAARMAQSTLVAPFEDVIIWGGNEPLASQLMFLSADGYFTPRAIRSWFVSKHDDTVADDFADDFNRANEDIDADANWTDVSAATNPLRVDTNQVRYNITGSDLAVAQVATATHTFADDQYAEATLAALGNSIGGGQIGVCARINTTSETCYAAIDDDEDPTHIWKLVIADFSTAGGSYTEIARGVSTPTAADVIRIECIGSLIRMYINGTLECFAQDTEITSGQAGLMMDEVATTSAGRMDDFNSADFVAEKAGPEGVWIHSRGAGEIAYFTSDGGTQFIPAATVTIEVNGVTEGTPCMIIAAETAGSVTVGDILLQAFANSLGVASASLIYEGGFGAGLDVDVKARNAGVAVATIAEAPQSTFVTETEEAADSTTNDMNLLPVSPAVNDAYYFAHNEQFTRLKLWITDANGTGSTIVPEYWDGLAWTALSGVVDGTNNFENTLENIVSWTLPGDWATTTVNGLGPLYYVRLRLTVVGSANQTRARQVLLDVTRYLPFPQSGIARRTILPTGLAVTAAWTEDTIGQFTQE